MYDVRLKCLINEISGSRIFKLEEVINPQLVLQSIPFLSETS